LPEIISKLFQGFRWGLLQLMNIFQHVQCRWNNFISVLDVVTREIGLKHYSNFENISKYSVVLFHM